MTDAALLRTLLDDLSDPDADERQHALDRLSDLAPADAVELIVARLQDEDEDVRVEAIICLRDLRARAAIPHLIQVLNTAPNDRIREYAILALAGFTGPEICDALVETWTKEFISNIARMRIVMQLWRYPHGGVIDILKHAVLHDEDRNVRSHAADSLYLVFRALGRPPEWESFWETVSHDPEIGVSRFADEARRG